MRRTFLAIALAGSIWGFAEQASAESLWARRDPRHAFLIFDTQARYVGDLVTIAINLNTDVQNNENRALSKQADAQKSWQLESMTGGDLGTRSSEAEFDFSGSSAREFDGQASFTSEQEFTTRITATVVDVLPNGDLVLQGHRDVFVAGDRRVLSVSGVVRVLDIPPSNTITSRVISNFSMSYDAEGPEQRYTRRGWLGRTIDWLWPD